ncbi:aspartate/glutamate racemase family protein [Alteromonas confluentis]|uniref:Aspartate racemase n=1 Tax=Alteromonas confluentis TaxID=1656094 RepID=A0A1E7Z7T0_9ALTE|nr:aspartate/glutamate racemase family protein [Alteromonas confluentis]OFC69588.1 aspartate racemase [Alteromonas confluentis]
MKTIGLLGGMSWESTVGYYRAINQGVKQTLGGLHSAKIVLVSVDFAEIEACQSRGDWETAGALLAAGARQLKSAGAECLLICTNTMHKVADAVNAATNLPLIHIADATAEQLVADKVAKVGLLGTAFTMEQDFYTGRLRTHGLDVIVPEEVDRHIVHRVIYEELCLGHTSASSKAEYLRIIDLLRANGAEAVILGCTEIGLLVTSADTAVPLLDTTAIHAQKAVEFALQNN